MDAYGYGSQTTREGESTYIHTYYIYIYMYTCFLLFFFGFPHTCTLRILVAQDSLYTTVVFLAFFSLSLNSVKDALFPTLSSS